MSLSPLACVCAFAAHGARAPLTAVAAPQSRTKELCEYFSEYSSCAAQLSLASTSIAALDGLENGLLMRELVVRSGVRLRLGNYGLLRSSFPHGDAEPCTQCGVWQVG